MKPIQFRGKETMSYNKKENTIIPETMTEKIVAYEWHNHETGHCYVDYIPHPEQDEKDGYTKTPLYAAQQSKMPTIDPHPDTEADGYVFCGKCGKMK